MRIKVNKGDVHPVILCSESASRPLVLWLVPMMLSATDASCVQSVRARDAPSDS